MVTLKKLTLENFGAYARVQVSFDENVTYLMGPNGSGKTLRGLVGFQFVMQGLASKKSDSNMHPVIGERFLFIGPDGKSAKGSVILHDSKLDCDIIVKRRMTKDGTEVSFEGPLGVKLDQKWLNDLFDIFMISPKYFESLSSKQQALALGIDLSEYDKKIKALKEEFTLIGRQITEIGTPADVEKVEEVRVDDVLQERKEAESFNAAQVARQTDIDNKRTELIAKRKEMSDVQEEIAKQKAKLAELEKEEVELILQGTALPKAGQSKDLYGYDEKIKKASETNASALAYKTYIETVAKLNKHKADLAENSNKQKRAIAKRVQAIKEFNLPYSNLEIDEEGQLLMDGRPIKSPYFSSGELIQIIPCLMSSRKPELRYVYLQDFNLLDEQKQQETVEFLTRKGLQLCIEYVGEKDIVDANILYMRDNQPEHSLSQRVAMEVF